MVDLIRYLRFLRQCDPFFVFGKVVITTLAIEHEQMESINAKLSTAHPRYSKHKASGQAFVKIEGQFFYLGLHGSEISTLNEVSPVSLSVLVVLRLSNTERGSVSFLVL